MQENSAFQPPDYQTHPRGHCFIYPVFISPFVGVRQSDTSDSSRFPRRNARSISITAPFERNYAFRPVPDSRRVASATKRTGELQNRKVSLPGEGRSIKAEIAARGRRSSYSSRGRIVNEPDLSHRHVYTKGKLLPIEEKREKYEM